MTDKLIQRTDQTLAGTFHSLKHNLCFFLLPIPSRGGDRDPTHRVVLVPGPGRQFEAGAAWKRQMKRGENAGADMFSITIDDPSFDVPLNITAFPGQDGPGHWDVTWKRPRPNPNASAPAGSPVGPAGNGAPPQDYGDPGPDPR